MIHKQTRAILDSNLNLTNLHKLQLKKLCEECKKEVPNLFPKKIFWNYFMVTFKTYVKT